MSSGPTTSEMLTELGACAYRLGVAFAEQAEAEAVWARKLELFQLFDRCFSGFRISVALDLRLRQAARRQDVAGEPAPAIERAEREPPDNEPLERERVDYERDRETERASLPLLLRTLGGVAVAADALPGPPPAELPTLRELLTRIGADARPDPGPADDRSRSGSGPPGTASGPGALRARLAGSAVIGLARPPPPPSSGLAELAVPRRRPPTGPPRR